jgi:hypothetical protein
MSFSGSVSFGDMLQRYPHISGTCQALLNFSTPKVAVVFSRFQKNAGICIIRCLSEVCFYKTCSCWDTMMKMMGRGGSERGVIYTSVYIAGNTS